MREIFQHIMSFSIFRIVIFSLLIFSNYVFGQLHRQGKDFALFFAVDDYPEGSSWRDLKNPISDAEALADILKLHYGFETEIHRNPTKKDIRAIILQWQQRNFAKNAQLFIFLSGHGTVDDFDDEGYFIPSDGQTPSAYFNLFSLRKAISQIACPHIFLTVDACYSGTIFRGNEPTFGRIGDDDDKPIQQVIENELQFPSRYILTSGGKERTSGGINHSPLTQRLLKVFSGERTFGATIGISSGPNKGNPRPATQAPQWHLRRT